MDIINFKITSRDSNNSLIDICACLDKKNITILTNKEIKNLSDGFFGKKNITIVEKNDDDASSPNLNPKYPLLDKKDNSIPIPDNIKLNSSEDIFFNNDEQIFYTYNGCYGVCICGDEDLDDYSDRFKLVPVDFKDVKKDDTITVKNHEDKLSWWFKVSERREDKLTCWYVSDGVPVETGIYKKREFTDRVLLKVVRRDE